MLAGVLFGPGGQKNGLAASAIDGGAFNSVAVKVDGTVWAWGTNKFGESGNGFLNASSPSPVVLNAGITNAIAVSSGGWDAPYAAHTLVLRSDGRVVAGGNNAYGQLGDNSGQNQTNFVLVSNLTNAVAVAAGGYHSLALKADGTVWAWGTNNYGQVGNGTTTAIFKTPTQVTNLAGVVSIAAGLYHGLALKTNGTVWAWGANGGGQIGNGTTVNTNIPTAVTTLSNVIAIAAGGSNSLALKADGTVWAWGNNNYGQVGNGTTNAAQTVPVQVTNLTNVVAVAAGGWHSLALRADGTVWAWGRNNYGQAGNGTTNAAQTVPVLATNLFGVLSLAAGEYHSLAALTSGELLAWGNGVSGQLGNGDTANQTWPVNVIGFWQNPPPYSTDIKNNRYSRGTGSDPTHYSFVIALDGQVGVTNVPGDSVSTVLAHLSTTTNLYHYDATKADSSTNLAHRFLMTNVITAFGSKYGGSPLYFNQAYHFGAYAGNNVLAAYRTQALLISRTNKTTGDFGLSAFTVPSPDSPNEWTYFMTNGTTWTFTDQGFTTTYSLLKDYAWGTKNFGAMVLTHVADTNAIGYEFTIWVRGVTDGNWMVLNDVRQGVWSPLYTVSFDSRPSTQAAFVSQPQFAGKPMPSAYQGKSLAELLAVHAVVTNAVAGTATNWLDLDNSPELRQHPILDQFVADMGSNAMALASYVQNEIELTDAVKYNSNTNLAADTSVNMGGVSRGALGVFMEGEGSPVEQCALLVYLLRRAGVPAAYMYGPYDGVQMLDAQLSKLLRMQIRGAVNDLGQVYTTNSLISVNYPWVAAYVNGQWIHLFPWLKDTEVTEGLNLYDYLPADYNNGYKWAKKYLYADTNILSLSSDTDVPSVLFAKFIQKSLLTTGPGISLDDIGTHAVNRRVQYARWSDFPTPFEVTHAPVNTVKDLTSVTNLFPSWTNIFDTVSVQIFSANATNKSIFTGQLRLADLHNRKLLLRHQTNGVNYDLILSLAAYRPALTNKLAFTNDLALLYPQQLTNRLATSNDTMTVRLTFDRHRTAPSVNASSSLSNSYLAVTEFSHVLIDSSVRLGDLAVICFNPGRVSKSMVAAWAQEYWNMQQQVKANPSLTNTLSPDITQGTLPGLMGMAYYERVSRFGEQLEQLHKVRITSILAAGLSKLSANRDASGNLIRPLALVHPHVDMVYQETDFFGNWSLRPDEGGDEWDAENSFNRMMMTEISAQEHKVIEDFYNQNGGVSTVKLLRQAQQPGQPGMVELNWNNYSSYSSLSNYDRGMWQSVRSAFDTNNTFCYFANVFITLAPIINTNAGYQGMGAMIYSGADGPSALISGNGMPQNGGWGSALPTDFFAIQNFMDTYLTFNTSGNSSWNVTQFNPANPPATPPSLSESVSWWDTVSIYNNFPSYSVGGANFAQQQQYDVAGFSLKLLGSDAFANAANYGGGYRPSVSMSSSQKASSLADPVNAVTGEFYVDATDAVLPGPMPMVIRRNYSSMNLDLGESQFGYGWRSACQPYLRLVTNNVILAAESDGTVVAYRQPVSATNYWQPFPADNPQLNNYSFRGIGSTANLFNNYITTNIASGVTNYYLTGADGSVRRFQTMSFPVPGSTGNFDRTRPYLQQWSDASSNSYTFSYQTDNTQPDYGQVRRIQSSNGSFLGFYYDVFGHIVEAYTGDGRWLKYDYDDHGDLITVTLPDESVINYTYQHITVVTNSTTNIVSTHLMITEEKPNGRVLANSYDNLRRVVTQAATVGGDLNLVTNSTFIYSNDFTNLTNSVVTGTTLVKDVFGRTNLYQYAGGFITNIVDALGQTNPQVWFSNANDPGYYPRSLKSMTDKRGLATDYQYDASGNLQQVILTGNLTGGSLTSETATNTFTYTSRNLIGTATDPAGNQLVYYYTNTACPFLPTAIVKQAGATPVSTNQFFYTNVAQVVTNGGVFTNCSYGVLARTITGGSATNDFTCDGRGFPTQQIGYTGTGDPALTNTFVFGDRGEMLQITDAAGRSRLFDFDAMGRRTAEEVYEANQTTPLGWNYSYYNENGDLVWSDGPRYNPEDYVWRDYDGAGRKITEIHWRSVARADGSGVQAATSDSLYATTFYQYDAFGNLIRAVDPRGAVTTNTWDALGRLTISQHLDTDGVTLLSADTFGYEPGGKIAFHTNALGGVTQNLYTFTGQPKFQSNADGSTNAWRYYLDGRINREIQGNGAYWETTYDDVNLITTRIFYSAADTPLATNSMQFDRRGNVIQQVDAGGNAFTTAFDGLDRVKVATGPAIVTVSSYQIGNPPSGPIYYVTNVLQQSVTNYFDAAGQVLTNVNTLGETTITWFDAIGRVTQAQVLGAAGSLVRQTSLAYSPDFNSVTVTNGSGVNAVSTTSYTDTFGNQLLSIGYPSAGVREFMLRQFDVAGNLISEQHDSSANGTITTWTTASFSYDGLNRLISKTDRDGAPTSYTFDPMGDLTNRTLPGGLQCRAAFNNAGQMLKDWNQNGGSITRSNAYVYFTSGSPFAGLLQTKTDGRATTRTYSYDDWLRLTNMACTGSLPEQNLTTTWQYEPRSFITGITEQFASTNTGPTTTISRSFDPYGQLSSESVNAGSFSYGTSQNWDATGRRTRLSIGSGNYGFSWQADGNLTSASDSTGSGSYSYNTAGLLTGRTVGNRSTSITSRDGEGRPLSIATTVNTLSQLNESLTWLGDGLLATHTLNRIGDFTDSRAYTYANLSRRLVQERLNLNASTTWTNTMVYDKGVAGGLGVLTQMGQAGGASNLWNGAVDTFSRIGTETNNTFAYAAYGHVNGQSTLNAWLDNQPVSVIGIGTNAMQWRAMMELSPGKHQLKAAALHPSGYYTAWATNSFTNNIAYQQTTNTFDGAGNVTQRIWKNPNGTTSRTQTLSWDARGRLHSVTERDAGNSGYNWTATYDALNRRLSTTTILVTNNIAFDSQPKTINQYYDPLVEFLELGVAYNNQTVWKLYGPDLNGVYGGLNGTGGFEGVSPYLNSFSPVISDFRGNIIAAVTNGTVSWSPARPTVNGAVPGYRPPSLGSGADISLSSAWHGRWADITGNYNVGRRGYSPVAQNWLSYDPAWNELDPNGFSYCGGDGLNNDDPDGKCVENTPPNLYFGIAPEMQTSIQTTTYFQNNSSVTTGLPGEPDIIYDQSQVSGWSYKKVTAPTGRYFSYVSENGLPANYGQTTIEPVNKFAVEQQQNLEGLKIMAVGLLYADGIGGAVDATGLRLMATEGRGLIGFVRPGGTIDPSLQSAYSSIANSSRFSASLSRYNTFARTFGLTETATADEINATLANSTTFARTPNIQAGLFTTENGFYLQGNPLTAYGARAGGHELVHLGAALRGQTDTWLHEIGVQYATTPENLLIGGGILAGSSYGGYYFLNH